MSVHYLGQVKSSYIKWDMIQPLIPDDTDAQPVFKCRCYMIHAAHFSAKSRWFCPESLRQEVTVSTYLFIHFHRPVESRTVPRNGNPMSFNRLNIRNRSNHKAQSRTDHMDLLTSLQNQIQLRNLSIRSLK